MVIRERIVDRQVTLALIPQGGRQSGRGDPVLHFLCPSCLEYQVQTPRVGGPTE